jgi:glycosyltransferase involved in cell wall biosynthesis
MSKRTTVVYVQPNSEIGGSDICLLRLVQALDKDRFEPIVVLPRQGPLVSAFERAGARIRFIKMATLRTKLSPLYQLGYLGRYWPTVLKLRSLLIEEQAQIVHTNSLYSLYGAWAARLANVPHVWHIREIPPDVPFGRAALAAFVQFMSGRVVCMTEACQRALFPTRVPEWSSVLYEGIDLSEFRRDITGERVRSELGIDLRTPVVGFVARLDPWKGLEIFVKAAAVVHERFPGAHFLVAGDAPQGYESHARKMRGLAAESGLSEHMHFCGFRHSFDAIPELMASLTMLCHTSVRPEPFGLVLIEAMAMSRPVIATRMGGPLEIVADQETGVLIPPGDPQQLAEAVCRLLANPIELQRMGEAGRRRVEERFPVKEFGAKLSWLYDSLLQPPARDAVAAESAARG